MESNDKNLSLGTECLASVPAYSNAGLISGGSLNIYPNGYMLTYSCNPNFGSVADKIECTCADQSPQWTCLPKDRTTACLKRKHEYKLKLN